MLYTQYKDRVNQALMPLGRALARLGVSPTAITLLGPVLASGVCWWFVQTGRVVPFCVLILLLGALDVLDGVVARASGRVTKFGAYLDAMCDRYYDSIVTLAVATVTGYWVLCLIVLVGAHLTSYGKARAAMEVSVSNQEWPDVMERGERSVLFMGGLLASALVPWQPLGHDLFWWALVILAVLSHLTVIQRVARAKRLMAERSRP